MFRNLFFVSVMFVSSFAQAASIFIENKSMGQSYHDVKFIRESCYPVVYDNFRIRVIASPKWQLELPDPMGNSQIADWLNQKIPSRLAGGAAIQRSETLPKVSMPQAGSSSDPLLILEGDGNQVSLLSPLNNDFIHIIVTCDEKIAISQFRVNKKVCASHFVASGRMRGEPVLKLSLKGLYADPGSGFPLSLDFDLTRSDGRSLL